MNMLDVEAELAKPPLSTDDFQQYFAAPLSTTAGASAADPLPVPEKPRVPLATLINNMMRQLKEVESDLGLTPTTTAGTRVDQGRLHAYGDLPVEQRRKEFKANVAKVRSILLTYQTWIGNEREVDVSRYLQMVHEENSRKAQLESTKKRLGNCQQLINRHFKTMKTAESASAAEGVSGLSSSAAVTQPHGTALVVGQKLLLRLNKMARKFNMQCDVFEAEKKWTTWTDDFVVDVSNFDSASRVQVELHRAEGSEAAIGEQLTAVLRSGTKQFRSALQHLVRLFELIRNHKEHNLLQLERQTIPATVTHALTALPHYRVESSLEGCRITYFIQPSNPRASPCVALLSIDESLPSSPKAEQLPDDLCYQLRLTPSIPFAATSFTLLANILTDKPPVVPAVVAREGAHFASLTELIVPREDREREVQIRGDTQRYIDGGSARGLLVKHIPVFRMAQVPFVLQVLRQQAVFNALVASCYPTAISLLPAPSAAASSYTTVELYMDPPRKLRACTFLPAVDGPNVSLEISIALGGELACQLILAAGSPPADAARFHSSEYLTKALQLSHSIPLTLRYALRK